jgi:hypothetical protein
MSKYRRSGMNRRQFLGAAGAGAAGLVGAGLMGSGVAHANGPVGFDNPKVALFYHTTSSTIWKQCVVIAKQVLDAAGINNVLIAMSTSDTGKPLIPVADPFPLGQAFNLNDCSVAKALEDGGYTAVIGTGTSSKAGILADGIHFLQEDEDFEDLKIQYLEFSATANTVNPKYSGSPYDDEVMYFHRTAVDSNNWRAALAQELVGNLEDVSITIPGNIAFLVRTNPSGTSIATATGLDSFGLQVKEGFDKWLMDNGYSTVESKLIVMNHTSTGMEFAESLGGSTETNLADILSSGTWMVGCSLNSSNAVKLVNAAKVANDTTPLYLGTSGTVYSQIEGNPTAYNFMQTNGVGVIAWHWAGQPEGAEAFEAWKSWKFKNPFNNQPYGNDPEEIDHRLFRALDAAWMLVKGLRQTNTQSDLYDFIEGISGTDPDPQEYPYKDLLLEPINQETYNYTGASGPIDFEDGECTISYFKVFVSLNAGQWPYVFRIPPM